MSHAALLIRLLLAAFVIGALASDGRGGMPAVLPTNWTADSPRPSWAPSADGAGASLAPLQAISFFVACLLLSAWGVKALCNSVRRDLPVLPWLSYGRSLSLVILWGLCFVVVLTMISGARELMTPGAWRKQGWTYTLASAKPADGPELRRDALEKLRFALWNFAATHEGRLPSAGESQIDQSLWEIPGWPGLNFLSVAGRAARPVDERSGGDDANCRYREPACAGDKSMNESPHSAQPTQAASGNGASPNFKSSGAIILAVLVATIVLGACLISPEAIEQLLLGWLYFPMRVVPQMTADWPAVVAGALCAAAFLVALHRALRWLARSFAPHGAWIGIRTTIAAALVIFLLFASGTAMVGATHQAVWLITGRTKPAEQERHPPAAFGVISAARETARRSQQTNNLKQVGIGFHKSHEGNAAFPPGGTMDATGRLMHGWTVYLGPYLVFSTYEFDFSIPWDEPPNDRLCQCALPIFLNPSIPEVFDKKGYGLSHIAGNIHVLPITMISRPAAHSPCDELMALARGSRADRRDKPLRIDDIRDGTANTILLGEAAGRFRPWGHPANVRDPAAGVGKTPDGFGGPPGAAGAQFLMCDGSVRFVSDQVSQGVIRALATPAGETIEPEAKSIRFDGLNQ